MVCWCTEYILGLKILVFDQMQLWIYPLIYLLPDWIHHLLLGKQTCIIFCQFFNSTCSRNCKYENVRSWFHETSNIKVFLRWAFILLAHPLVLWLPRIIIVWFALPLLILDCVSQTLSPSFLFTFFLISTTTLSLSYELALSIDNTSNTHLLWHHSQ